MLWITTPSTSDAWDAGYEGQHAKEGNLLGDRAGRDRIYLRDCFHARSTTMLYEIIWISDKRKDRHGRVFRRIKLKPEDYGEHKRVLFVDVVKGFRNNMWWVPILREGLKALDQGHKIFLRNVGLKDEAHIDADVPPMVVKKA